MEDSEAIRWRDLCYQFKGVGLSGRRVGACTRGGQGRLTTDVRQEKAMGRVDFFG